ncbi:MAG: hypothetical protein V4487_05570 [Chlamydiota bacterium]
MNQKQMHRRILFGCIAASLFLHGGAFLFLQKHSLWFSSPPLSEKSPETSWLSSVEKAERTQILKEAFENKSEEGTKTLHSHSLKPEPVASTPIRISVRPPSEDFNNSFPDFLPSLNFPISELLKASSNGLSFSIPTDPFNLLDHLPKELIALSKEKTLTPPALRATHPSPLEIAPTTVLQSSALPVLDAVVEPIIAYSEPPVVNAPILEPRSLAKAPNLVSFPDFPKIPSLTELETTSYSDAFDAELVFLPRSDGVGYIFAITLIPRPDLDLPKMKQHFTFLIDRSNSIQADRLSSTKTAVLKALGELFPEDTFNLIVFDSKMEKLSAIPLSATSESIAKSSAFLEKIQLGSFFSSADLYKPLVLTVPGTVKNDEVYTAILLTDGENLAKKNGQRALLYDWTHYNAGKVALFAVGMGSDPHLSTLDTAAVFNKGKLSFSPSKRGLKRKLLKLMKTIRIPVAKNLRNKAICNSFKSKIELYPKTSQMPHLYLDQPYVILGTTDTLDDFVLFVQGRLKDRWLNIKKQISFLSAKKGGQSLKAEWALQQAYTLYEKYIVDQNPKHLADATTLLEPFDLQVAFK